MATILIRGEIPSQLSDRFFGAGGTKINWQLIGSTENSDRGETYTLNDGTWLLSLSKGNLTPKKYLISFLGNYFEVSLGSELPSFIEFSDLVLANKSTGTPSAPTQQEIAPIVQEEIAKLDYDKFLGTIGLAADKPADSAIPHYTTFPANPQQGNWLRSISDATVDGRKMLLDQEWYCSAESVAAVGEGKAKPAVWEPIQAGSKKLQYATYASNIGELVRYLDDRSTTDNTVKSDGNSATYVNLFGPFAGGVFDQNSIKNSPLRLTNLGNLVVSKIAIDITIEINLTLNLEGTRTGYLRLYSYYPDGQKLYDLQLTDSLMKRTVADPRTPIVILGTRLRLPEVEPLDDTPLTYALGVSVSQNSGSVRTINYCTFKMTAWG